MNKNNKKLHALRSYCRRITSTPSWGRGVRFSARAALKLSNLNVSLHTSRTHSYAWVLAMVMCFYLGTGTILFDIVLTADGDPLDPTDEVEKANTLNETPKEKEAPSNESWWYRHRKKIFWVALTTIAAGVFAYLGAQWQAGSPSEAPPPSPPPGGPAIPTNPPSPALPPSLPSGVHRPLVSVIRGVGDGFEWELLEARGPWADELLRLAGRVGVDAANSATRPS